MELNERAEINEYPLLAIGRQSFDLTPPENGCQATSSNWSLMGSHGGTLSTKGQHWENDEFRDIADDTSSQAQPMLGHHRAKRQHSWNDTCASPNNFYEQGSTQSDCFFDRTTPLGPPTQLSGCCETGLAGNSGFDFFQRCPGQGASSSSSLPPRTLVAPNKSTRPALGACSIGAESDTEVGPICSEGEQRITRDLLPATLGQYTCNAKGKASEGLYSSVDHSSDIGGNSGLTIIHNSLLPWLDGDGGKLGSMPGNITDLCHDHRSGHVNREFCATHKRKLFSPDFASTSAFDPQCTTTIENVAGTTEGSGSTSDVNGFASVHPTSDHTSMIHIWSDSHSVDARDANDGTTTLSGNDKDLMRCHPDQSVRIRHESMFSRVPLHLARMIPHAESFTRRNPDVMHSNPTSSINFLPDAYHWPLSAGERSAPAPGVGNWGTNSDSGRSFNAILNPGMREREMSTGGALEGGPLRSRTLDWVLAAAAAAPPPLLSSTMEHRIANQVMTNVSGSVTDRGEIGSTEPGTRIPQDAHSLFHSGSRASFFSGSGSGVRRVSRSPLPPPPPPVLVASNEQIPVVAPLEAHPALPGQHPGHYTSPSPSQGRRDAILTAPVQSVLGLPFRGFRTVRADGEYRRQFLSEILNAMHNAFGHEDLNIEELAMLDPSLLYGGVYIRDQHWGMRLDVDNMTYEELLALEERIGNVNTGLDEEKLPVCVRESKYSSLDATIATLSQESDVKCSICQEEFVEEDDLGRLDCGHGYHSACIKQWLLHKNECPICKASAYVKP